MRADVRRRRRRAAGGIRPTSCCWSAAPTAATSTCCCTTPRGIAKARLSRTRGGRRQRRGARPRWPASSPRTGRRFVVTANVLPRIGVVAPEAARAAIREAFLTHVIGGKGLSRGRGFAELVRAATPDAVLRGVEVLADVAGRRRARGRRRRGDDRRLLGDHARRARTPTHPPRGRRHPLARPHRGGRPRHAVDRGRGRRGGGPRAASARRRHGSVRRRGRPRHRPPGRHGCRVGRRGVDRLDGRGGGGAPARPAPAPVGATAPARRGGAGRRLRGSAAARARGRRRPGAVAGHRRPRWGVAGARARGPAGGCRVRALRRRACWPTATPRRRRPWPPRSRAPAEAKGWRTTVWR